MYLLTKPQRQCRHFMYVAQKSNWSNFYIQDPWNWLDDAGEIVSSIAYLSQQMVHVYWKKISPRNSTTLPLLNEKSQAHDNNVKIAHSMQLFREVDRGWRNGSLVRVVVMQAWYLNLNPQHTHEAGCDHSQVCNSSAVGVGWRLKHLESLLVSGLPPGSVKDSLSEE